MSKRDFRSEDVLFKEVLFYELLYVLPEGPAMDGLVSLAFMIEAVLVRPGSEGLCWSGLERLTHG